MKKISEQEMSYRTFRGIGVMAALLLVVILLRVLIPEINTNLALVVACGLFWTYMSMVILLTNIHKVFRYFKEFLKTKKGEQDEKDNEND